MRLRTQPNHALQPTAPMHTYEIRPRKDKRGVDLISDALPFGGLWYLEVSDAIEYAKHGSRAHDAAINVYDAAGNVIETHDYRPRSLPQCHAQYPTRFADTLLPAAL
jgi:hypothetical protein